MARSKPPGSKGSTTSKAKRPKGELQGKKPQLARQDVLIDRSFLRNNSEIYGVEIKELQDKWLQEHREKMEKVQDLDKYKRIEKKIKSLNVRNATTFWSNDQLPRATNNEILPYVRHLLMQGKQFPITYGPIVRELLKRPVIKMVLNENADPDATLNSWLDTTDWNPARLAFCLVKQSELWKWWHLPTFIHIFRMKKAQKQLLHEILWRKDLTGLKILIFEGVQLPQTAQVLELLRILVNPHPTIGHQRNAWNRNSPQPDEQFNFLRSIQNRPDKSDRMYFDLLTLLRDFGFQFPLGQEGEYEGKLDASYYISDLVYLIGQYQPIPSVQNDEDEMMMKTPVDIIKKYKTKGKTSDTWKWNYLPALDAAEVAKILPSIVKKNDLVALQVVCNSGAPLASIVSRNQELSESLIMLLTECLVQGD